MPTPFTHLQITHQLAHDEQVPQSLRTLFENERPAFLLGGIIADQKAHEKADREVTHFYRYDKPMLNNPWREMLRQHPTLITPRNDAQKAFIGAYVAHLAVDEYWSRYMLKPNFAEANWASGIRERFFMLHMLLAWMDERDEARLADDVIGQLMQCQPDEWLPFMPDSQICDWRDFITDQLQGTSHTITILAERIHISRADFRMKLDDEAWMQQNLWQSVPPHVVATIEHDYYCFAREQLLLYMNGDFRL